MIKEELDKVYRQNKHALDLLKASNPTQEEEYFFDESVGVSLEDHIADLKRTPGLKVETRTDREGLVKIRKSMTDHFSINLDRFLEEKEGSFYHEILDIYEDELKGGSEFSL